MGPDARACGSARLRRAQQLAVTDRRIVTRRQGGFLIGEFVDYIPKAVERATAPREDPSDGLEGPARDLCHLLGGRLVQLLKAKLSVSLAHVDTVENNAVEVHVQPQRGVGFAPARFELELLVGGGEGLEPLAGVCTSRRAHFPPLARRALLTTLRSSADWKGFRMNPATPLNALRSIESCSSKPLASTTLTPGLRRSSSW